MCREFGFENDIVIISSNPDIIELKNLILKNITSRIIIINCGSEAVYHLKKNRADVLLLDADLPDMDASDVLSFSVRSAPSSLIIMISNEEYIKKTEEYLHKGAYDYIERPFRTGKILNRITNAVERNRLKHELESGKKRYAELERRYQNIVQNTQDIIYSLDNEGRFTFVNDHVKNILGYNPDQLIGRHYSTVLNPEHSVQAYHFGERRSKNRPGASTDSTFRFELKAYEGAEAPAGNKKRHITVQVQANGVYGGDSRDNDKKFLGTYGVARDISGLVDIEEFLNIQSVYFRELFGNSAEAIVILDCGNNIIDANRSFENIFSYSNDELKSNNLHDLIVPEDLKDEAETLSGEVFSKGGVKMESVRKRKDGSMVEVSILGYPIIFNDKNIGMIAVYSDLTGSNGSRRELKETLEKLQKTINGIVHAMVSTVEVRDPYTAGHQERVANLAKSIALELNLPGDEIEGIRMAGTLHDLGKVNIPAEILSRPGQLTDIEFSLIKRHPEIAYKILQNIDTPWPIADIVFQHHERLDGSGYPLGLRGEEIKLASRILTVADVVEAIASHRPYRPALGVEKALCEITRNSGILYDEAVVNACVKIIREERVRL